MDRQLDFKKSFMLAVLWWLIMFGAVSLVLPWYNQYEWMKFDVAVFAGIMAFVLAGYTIFYGYSDAWLFGVIFVATGLMLDMIVTFRFNAEIFTYWQLWLGYAFVLFAPVFRIMRRR